MGGITSTRSGMSRAAWCATPTGQTTSTSSGRWGPCCSIDPMGTTTTFLAWTAWLISGHVSFSYCQGSLVDMGLPPCSAEYLRSIKFATSKWRRGQQARRRSPLPTVSAWISLPGAGQGPLTLFSTLQGQPDGSITHALVARPVSSPWSQMNSGAFGAGGGQGTAMLSVCS